MNLKSKKIAALLSVEVPEEQLPRFSGHDPVALLVHYGRSNNGSYWIAESGAYLNSQSHVSVTVAAITMAPIRQQKGGQI